MINERYLAPIVEALDNIDAILKANAKEYADDFNDPVAEERIYSGSVVMFIGIVVDRFMDNVRGK